MSMLATALTTIVLFGGDYGEWVVEVQSFGEDVNWESPSTVRTDAVFYYRYHNVTAIDAWVSYLGFEFGPFDVLYMIDDTDDEGLGFGPLPLDFPSIEFLTPEPPEPMAVRFDFNTWMTADGHLGVGVDNVEFGTAEYDLGWPFGTVTVTVEGIGLAAAISITASDDLCVGDMDGNGVVDTNDLLAVIGGWGECPADLEVCSGDGTLDGYVDIMDLLWVIGQFGPCP
jgi:hypothetical protein